ncbi:hypothetical protein lbkm_2604 [Lachnospiraceae bacterium KM106-2]|nr:hypothetical protein lbkm_2604 [Lachnospiraceae bacterium KM106-2]
MKYTLSLIKKDFLLNRKMLIVLFLAAIIIPIFIQSKLGKYGFTPMPFFITEFLILYILFGNSSMLDYKYKGAVLLSTTPYKRKTVVCASYAFLLVCFVSCFIIYQITSLVPAAKLPTLGINTVGAILLGNVIFYGIIIPLQYYFGYEKMKFITYMIVFLVPFCMPQIAKFLQDSNLDLSVITKLQPIIKGILVYGSMIVISLLSMILSIKIYAKKDL